MASLDRQALLEQKRRRLQELKERRTGVALVDATQPNLAIVEPEAPRSMVDFAVQVDFLQPAPAPQTAAPNSQPSVAPNTEFDQPLPRPLVKFDKIIQTHFERTVDLGHLLPKRQPLGPAVDPGEPAEPERLEPAATSGPDLATETRGKVELSLDEFLRDAGFHFSDLRLGLRHEEAIDRDVVAPFTVTKSVSDFISRPVVAVAATPDHPDVFLAAYGKPHKSPRSGKRPLTALAGLAVLFNRSSDAIVPEFFLQCTSYIRTIMFDQTNPFKVFAGLENGRVVMWDLASVEPTRVAVLPTLQTSTVASSAVKSQHNFIHHISPIVLMTQLNTETAQSSGILSICEDGVVNLWSPNFLAFPKIASLKLADHDTSVKIPFKLTDALILLAILRVHEQTGHQNPPEYNFLNLTVAASRNGTIYKLVNAKEKAYIRAKLVEAPGHEQPWARDVNSVVELKYSPATTLLISAHADWSLKLWDSESCRLRHVLPTSTLVSTIIVRPGHSSQFITIGNVRPPKIGLFVEFWDLKAKILGPISTIPTREKKLGSALFNADGSEMVLGYDDGEIDIFSIEESLLSSQIQFQTHRSVDEGIDKLLSAL
ncbi:hypothetical protein METBIDRAFT_170239 [Metschnikowia bicuspidata var. bicuspidata NRRL YB-4993]|uniref:Uncharacterized protein n=1 Tax=Metschnikowia bicuspidata var. bicuspidata NRRL YB-4993 TaxID=869754 RepID=A0A1A0HAF0_9ASCO|nr:hypothetical protein METBIDRAFT_170239 [Metschnikowia bicuspidata var. bicuspidata NRRL YB-4993]OBA20980.1 hypothetical protein METBIDRAFT_170239 [Metschnikowia bicuspidata var. bicuspidata NRRL YB-4993]